MAAPEDQPVLRFRSGFAGDLGSKLHSESLEGEGTDVEIRFGETSKKTVHAHSLILQTASEVFKVMLSERWKKEKKPEDGKTLIDLPEDNYSDFVLFLQLLYGFQDLTISNFSIVLRAYRLVDKYAAHGVLRLCDEYFQFLIDNMEKLDAARLLWMAKDYHIEMLYEAAMKYVKTNLHTIWDYPVQVEALKLPYDSWMDWDEQTLIEIISTNGLKAGRELGEFDWSLNEFRLAVYTQVWLFFGRCTSNEQDRTCHEPPTHREAHDVHLGSSSRLFSKIRFRQMNDDYFRSCVRFLLSGTLSKVHIADICLAYCASGEDLKGYKEESDFAVDGRLRNI